MQARHPRTPPFLPLVLLTALFLPASCGSPRTESPHLAPGIELLSLGDLDGALAHLDRGVEAARAGENRSHEVRLLRLRAHTHQEVARRREGPPRDLALAAASRDLKSILEILPAGSSLRREARYALGQVQGLRGDAAGRERSLEILVEQADPTGEGQIQPAHGELGWIVLERYLSGRTPDGTEGGDARDLERAMSLFNLALMADERDALGLLGQGICLYEIGLEESAREALERSLSITSLHGFDNPVAHLYLALSLEKSGAPPSAILEHLDAALRTDPRKQLERLYVHLLETLPLYYTPEDENFTLALDGILAQSASGRDYWERAHRLFDSYIASLPTLSRTPGDLERRDELYRQAYLGRALARRRLERVEEASRDILELAREPDFENLLDRVFPPGSPDAADLHGRLLCLRELGDLGRLRELVLDPPAASPPEPGAPAMAWRVEELYGLILLDLTETELRPGDGTPGRLPPESELLRRAREHLERYLDRHPGSIRARLGLARALEGLDRREEAILQYGQVAQEDPTHQEAFRHLIRLHSERGLDPDIRRLSWGYLRNYEGEEVTISTYVDAWKMKLKREQELYCRGCGRKTRASEFSCLYCGRSTLPVPRRTERREASGESEGKKTQPE